MPQHWKQTVHMYAFSLLLSLKMCCCFSLKLNLQSLLTQVNHSPFPFRSHLEKKLPAGFTSELRGPNSVKVVGVSSHRLRLSMFTIESHLSDLEMKKLHTYYFDQLAHSPNFNFTSSARFKVKEKVGMHMP